MKGKNMIKKNDIADVCLLTPMQEGMLFHYLMDKKSPAYFEQTAYRIQGQLEFKLFEKAFMRIVERHDVLRTIFVFEKVPRPLQVVLKKRNATVCYEDISGVADEQMEKVIAEFKIKDKARGFNLEKDILIRLTILKIADNKFEIIWSFHHIILDGWCITILIKDMMLYYNSLIQGKTVNLPPAVPFKNYLKWIERQDKNAGSQYWKNYLEDYTKHVMVPQCLRVGENEFEQKSHRFVIDLMLFRQLERIAGKNSVTISSLFQTLWGILLQKYNDTHDVVFGSVVSGRPEELEGIQRMVGIFINTIPVRIKSEPGEPVMKLAKKVQNHMIQSHSYAFVPLAEIQSFSPLKRNIINHILVIENFPTDVEIKKLNENSALALRIESVKTFEQTNYDLDVIVTLAGQLNIQLKYNGMVYHDDTISRIEMHLVQIMQMLGMNPEILIEDVEIISPLEKKQLLFDFNNTDAEYPKDKTVHQLFEEQMEKTPNHIAVSGPSAREGHHSSIQLTYKELNEKSNRLSRLLRQKNTPPQSIIGIMGERSIEIIIGILGVLKSGCAYLPIDSSYPDARKTFIFSDSGSKILLTDKHFSEGKQDMLASLSIDHILFFDSIDSQMDSQMDSGPQENPGVLSIPEDIAYIIYTSGTTGIPKGVLVKHRGVVNYIWWAAQNYVKGESANFPLYTSISFDLTITSIFAPLVTGNSIVVYAEEKKNFVLEEITDDNRVEVIKLTPSHLKLIKDTKINKNTIIKRLIVGGEELETQLAEDIFHVFNGEIEIYNEYGPTETAVGSMIYRFFPGLNNNRTVLIGVPINNTRIYILDKTRNVQPVGVPGEIYIAGDGVARGYLNRPDLTAEKFLENSFEESGRMYRTGDLAKWLPDGNIEFIGRTDSQVKIRGYRIELGEIENALLKLEKIKEVAVVASFDDSINSDKYLCAYLVYRDTGGIKNKQIYHAAELRDYLSTILPDYMIPSYFIQLEEIPLTQSGKLDRKLLPKPNWSLTTSVEFEAPTHEIEKIVAEIWKEVLGVKRPGINDNFFDSGGHSLKAITLSALIHKRLDVKIPINELFKNPTIKEISTCIRNAGKNIYASINPVEKREYYPLSSAQMRLAILDRLEEKSIKYNVSYVLALTGQLDRVRLENALKDLIKRHESLRTSFHLIHNTTVQIIEEDVPFGIEYFHEHENTADQDRINTLLHGSFIRPFDLSRAPLMRVGVIVTGENKSLLMLDIHHIVCDGVSIDTVVQDISKLVAGEKLPELRIQYKDYAVWQRGMSAAKKIQDEEDYWLENMRGELPVLNLFSDYHRPPIFAIDGDRFVFKIDRELSLKIKKLSRLNRATLYITLLAVYNVLLYKYTGQEDIIVGTPTAGRPHADLQHILGMFVNMLAMRNFPIAEKSFIEFLQNVKESALKAFDNQDYQFEELVVKLDLRRDLNRNPLFDTVFAVQNMEVGQITLPGLKLSQFSFAERTAKFDLSFYAYEAGEDIHFKMNYCTRLFKLETITRMCRHFVHLLEEVVEHPESQLYDMQILSATERQYLLYEFNDTHAHYPREKTIHGLFEQQVDKHPDFIAIKGPTLEVVSDFTLLLTYRELNNRAQRLASLLQAKGLGPESIVAIMVERSVEMIIGLLAILKAGGIYLPIAPDYPVERVNFILADSHAAIMLTANELMPTHESISPLLPEITEHVSPQQAAYIIYTSGTTGKPKGVIVDHYNVVRLLCNDKFQFHFGSSDVWTMFHAFNFDFSVWEMYGALLYGGKLIIIPKMVALDPVLFREIVRQERVTVLNQTPSAFYNFSEEELKHGEKELCVRYVIFGGEALKPLKLKKWREKYPATTLVNMFGITETTVHVTYKEICAKEIEYNISNIGVPIPTTCTYIVDKHLNLQPIGAPGELLVGNAGVSRGYLNRPELTAEKFISSPFNRNERIYRSGDLARFLPDQEMEYLGRIDLQVQLKGFRIEIGEIESYLLRYEGIDEAVVIAKENEDGDCKSLCAYIVSTKTIDIFSLREYLTKKIPNYMIPNYFVQIENIPLTTNGKIDRAKLPDPGANIEVQGEYSPPTNNVQEALVQIWQRVLNLEHIGIKDNYFHVGGDSIKAIELISTINNHFLANLKIVDLYINQTLEGLSLLLHKKDAPQEENFKELLPELTELNERVQKIAGDPGNIEDIFPMSDIEKGMVFHYIKDSGGAVYHDQPVYQMSYEDFDIKRMRHAFLLMMAKHPILRTAYMLDELAHIVYKNVPMDIPYHEIAGLTKVEKERYVTQKMIESRQRPFDISVPPLWRLSFFNLGNPEILVLWEFHHAIIDGWSNASLLTELNNTYLELKDNPDFIPPMLKYGFKEFILQQLLEKRKSEIIDYWKNELFDYKRLRFPTPIKTNAVADSGKIEFKNLRKTLGEGRREKLENTARKFNTTLKHLCFTANALMLNMLSYENDMVLGLVTNNRPLNEDGNKMIGCFLNSAPVRVKIPDQCRYLDFIQRIDQKMLQLKKYDRFPLLEIATMMGEETSEKNPLFDTLFNFIDFHAFSQVRTENFSSRISASEMLHVESYEKTNFPFGLNVHTARGGFQISIDYSTEILSHGDVEKLFALFKNILDKLSDEPESLLDKNTIITPAEKQEILIHFNDTQADFPSDKTLHSFFEEQVQKVPHRIAVMFGNKRLTYKELDTRVNTLVSWLTFRGVEAGSIVGLRLYRSLEMMVALFGILKAGCAYLPISPDYPEERIKFLLADSAAKIVLTPNELAEVIEGKHRQPFEKIKTHCSPLDTAYIIYTSGTTGRPKGVMISHRAIVNRLNWMQRKYPLHGKDIILQKTPITFDVSVWELFWWSIEGAAVSFLEPHGEKNPEVIVREIETRQITTMHFVPSMLSAFLEYISETHIDLARLKTLKRVFASGESLSVVHVERFNSVLNRSNGTSLINLYGPTEAAVDVSYFNCPTGEIIREIPIGKPIDNIHLYILDRNKRIQPIGVEGELYIAGAGLARGYLNRPELTAEKFVSLSLYDDTPLYGTGDAARWLPDGNIEFIGRIDQQVKIKGVRIELGEIETLLLKHDQIKDTVVLVKEENTGNKSLVAYFVADTAFSNTVLREYLLKDLPDYMVPAYFVQLEKIPLTLNGKVDRKALPAPEFDTDADNYAAPRNEIEKKLVEIWESVLGKKSIGVNDNFFYFGGDSIKSIQIISRLNHAGYKLEMKDIFQYPVLAKLALQVRKVQHTPSQAIVTGVIPLTPIQHAFFDGSPTDHHHFNQAVMLYSATGLAAKTIKTVFEKIQEHHDALRITFKIEYNKETTSWDIQQENHGLDYPIDLKEYDLTHLEANSNELSKEFKEKINALQEEINLEKGPLLKLGLFHLSDGDRLLIVIHHLVIDGLSWRILFEDIQTLYTQITSDQPPRLPAKTDSFKHWSEQLHAFASHKTFLKEKTYWAQLNSQAVLPIKKDFDVAGNAVRDTQSLSFYLEEAETTLLLNKVNQCYNTEINDILLTALGVAIKKTLGQDHVLIALEGHGRENISGDIDISRTVGWFTAVYPVLMDVLYTDDIGRQIKEVKETLRKIPNKGIGYGIFKYLTPHATPEPIEFNLNPQLIFNYLGQFDADVTQMSLFQMAKESMGDLRGLNNHREYELEINGMTVKNRLSMTISYNKTHFKPDTITALSHHFKSELQNIIVFCSTQAYVERTPSDFTYNQLTIPALQHVLDAYSDVEDIYPLSPMQEGMLFYALLDQSSLSYFEQATFRMFGQLDIPILEKSLNELVKRHEILRTAFVHKNTPRPLQVVLKDRPMDFYYQDISHIVDIQEKENFIREFKLKDKKASFDLSLDTLMRTAILQLDQSTYEFIWSFHHILMDGWCLGILNGEFFQIYSASVLNKPYQLPIIKPYRTYIQWLEKQDKDESNQYWDQYLDSFDEQTSIPRSTIVTQETGSPQLESVSIHWDREKKSRLNHLTAANHVTLNILMQAIWGILLGKYNRKDDVLFGVVVSGRPSQLEGIENIMGLFINTIPVRIRFDQKIKFNHLLKKIQDDALASEPYHYYPLAEIQSRSTLKQKLIDHILIFENYPITEQIAGYGKDNTNKIPIEFANPEFFEQTNYDLNVIFSDTHTLQGLFEYNANIYHRNDIKRMVDCFLLLLDQVSVNDQVEISKLEFLSQAERQRVLFEFNNTAVPYPDNKTIYQLFEDQVHQFPDYLALVFENHSLTFRACDNLANQLAWYLCTQHAVLPGAPIAVLMDRSVELIIVLIAVMKARAAYVPMDVSLPAQRLRLVFNDAAMAVAITEQRYLSKISSLQAETSSLHAVLAIEDMQKDSQSYSITPPPTGTETDPAYIMYTSGSTGVPKGVLVEHRTIVNTIIWRKNNYEYAPGHVSLQVPPYFFDSSVTDIFTPLLGAARLVLIKDEERSDLTVLRRTIVINNVTHFIVVPIFYNVMLEEIAPDLKHIKMICCAGDNFPDQLIKKHFERLPHVRIFNEYGPTENSVNTTAFELTPLTPRAVIGKPISNVCVYVLDPYLGICPIGVTGELCLAGASLSRGYLNRPELTAEKFVRSPLPFTPFYRTGDLGRWLVDGNLEFLGRVDNQVKIRGMRVEIGEIENQLLKHHSIKEVVVQIKPENSLDNYLCAYIVPHSTLSFSFEPVELKNYLAQFLPPYMIPTHFFRLEKLPLTPNGKLDSHVLPVPQADADVYSPPRNELERKMVEIWDAVLGKKNIGIQDNFFASGGDSIKSIQILSRLNSAGYKLEMKDLFQYPTIADLSPRIKKLHRVPDLSSITWLIPLNPIQKSFISHYPLYFNQKALLKEIPYWTQLESQLVPPIPNDFPVAGKNSKDMHPITFTLDETETTLLLGKANRCYNTQSNDLLLTAFCVGFQKTFGQSPILLSFEVHPRGNMATPIDISNTSDMCLTVQSFTSTCPVILDIFQGDFPGRQIIEIKETLRKIPSQGMGYGILKYLTNNTFDQKIDFKLKPQIIFHAPEFRETHVKKISLFQVAQESTGEYELEINGKISNRRLTLTVTYNKTHYQSETMTSLAHFFHSELQQIITYCASLDTIEPTPSDFSYKELTVQSLQQLLDIYPEAEDIYPLSPMQEGMLFHALLDQSSHSYFQQTSYRLQGDFDIPLVEKSVNELAKHHDILRTAFVHKNTPRPLQIVLRNRPVAFYYQDISHFIDNQEKENFVQTFKTKDKNTSFDLSTDILMRASILRLEKSTYEFIWSFHHILMDGWCIGIISNEFFDIYSGYVQNHPPSFRQLKPYRTYIEWLENIDKDESHQYWKNYLQSFDEQTPILKPRTKKDEILQAYNNKKISATLDIEKTQKLYRLAARNNVTINTITQTIWAILLGKYNQKEDVVFGTVVSGRPAELEDVESMMGLFINTIPVRIRFLGKTKFQDLIQKIQAEALASEAYHHHPLAEIQSSSPLKQNLIDHLFEFDNYFIADLAENNGHEKKKSMAPSFQMVNIERFGQTNFDFNISIGGTTRLTITIQYNGNAVDDDYIERITSHYQVAIDQIIQNEELSIAEITLLSPQERARLLMEFNDTAAQYPAKTIPQLFIEQSQRTPDHIATIGYFLSVAPSHRGGPGIAQCQITYAQLFQKSSQVAYYLSQQGVLPDAIVAIKVERSIEMIIGILGILLAGAAYLPIDPDYPEDRSQFMLSDSNTTILLTHELIQEVTLRTFITPITPVTPINLAYVIYTSGTTGKPKGVLVTQENVVRLFFNDRFQFRFSDRDVWTMFHSYCFDFSVWEMYGALLYGGKLVLIPCLTAMDTAHYLQILKSQAVTVLNQTPSAFYRLMEEEIKAPDRLLCLRYIVFGGEALHPGKINQWQQKYPHTHLINMYGITETTVHVTYKEITCQDIENGLSIIGTPIPTLTIYLLDKYNQLVPIGIPGEIFVGGAGVARGYLNRPELTQDKFIHLSTLPTSSTPLYTTLYKSGDLARWLPDGNLEYLGRIDHQVKIRGFRIELGEIEARLKAYPPIKETVVIDRKDGEKQYLCAYYSADDQIRSTAQLKEFLEEKLPTYMVPACFVKIDTIPLNANGKLDRPMLPLPFESDFHGSQVYQAPENPIQHAIVEIWQDVLGRQRVGVQDNFFDLGGDSLDFVKVANKLREKLNKEIPVATLFTYPTIISLEHYLASVQLPMVTSVVPETFVMLNGTPRPIGNIFFVHEVLGDVGAYMEFCKQLGTQYNCWGMEADKLKNFVPINVTVEEISAKYIQQIKKIQPLGPYNIFTWSWGGHLGLEMALQLERMGETLSFLGFADCSGPDSVIKGSRGKFTLETERFFIGHLFKIAGNTTDLNQFTDIDQLWTMGVEYLTSDPRLVERLREMLIYNAVALPNYNELTGQELIQFNNLNRSHNAASPKYIPLGKIHVPLHFFWANQNPNRVESWRDYCHNPVVYHEINGDHHSIFRNKEHIDAFASTFSEVIAQEIK